MAHALGAKGPDYGKIGPILRVLKTPKCLETQRSCLGRVVNEKSPRANHAPGELLALPKCLPQRSIKRKLLARSCLVIRKAAEEANAEN
jgi:hypothetical protein